jgi:hypothetical protein
LNPSKCTFGVEAGKFIGFMLTNCGIEINPEKCIVILNMQSPMTIKEVLQLMGRIAVLTRFLSASARSFLLFFQMLRNRETFNWDPECEKAFHELKAVLASPPVLSRPDPNQMIYPYLAVADEAVSAALVKEESQVQSPIYFVSKTLQGSELNYQRLEKVSYTLHLAFRRLCLYFLCHPIIVRTNQPIWQVLHKTDLAGRMMTWAVELSQYDKSYEPRQAIKAQVLAEFLAEMTHPGGQTPRS